MKNSLKYILGFLSFFVLEMPIISASAGPDSTNNILFAANGISGSPEDYYNNALELKEKGELPAASLALRRALILAPTLHVAQEQLDEVLLKMGLPVESHWQQKIIHFVPPEALILVGSLIGWGAAFIATWLFFTRVLSKNKKEPTQSSRPFILARIFHTHRDEEAAKPDEARRTKDFDVGLYASYCPNQNSNPTQHSSGFPASAVDGCEIFWLALVCFFLGHALAALGLMIDPKMTARRAALILPKQESSESTTPLEKKTSAVPLRNAPIDNGAILTQLPAGSLVTLLSRHGVWSYIRMNSGEEGWVVSSALKSVIPRS